MEKLDDAATACTNPSSYTEMNIGSYCLAIFAFVLLATNASACSVCTAEIASVGIPFYPIWFLVFAVWMCATFVVRRAHKTFRFPVAAFVVCFIILMFDVIQTFPFLSLLFMSIILIFHFVECSVRVLRKKGKPGDRVCLRMDLAAIVVCAATAVYVEIQVVQGGVVYELRRLDFVDGHGSLSHSLRRKAVNDDVVDATNLVVLLAMNEPVAAKNALYILEQKKEQYGDTSVTGLIMERIRQQADGRIGDAFAKALHILTGQLFTNRQDATAWWKRNCGQYEGSNAVIVPRCARECPYRYDARFATRISSRERGLSNWVHCCTYDWNIPLREPLSLYLLTVSDAVERLNAVVRSATTNRIPRVAIVDASPSRITLITDDPSLSNEMSALVTAYHAITGPLIAKGVHGGYETHVEVNNIPARTPVACALAEVTASMTSEETPQGVIIRRCPATLECRVYRVTDALVTLASASGQPPARVFADVTHMTSVLDVCRKQNVIPTPILEGVVRYMPERKTMLAIETPDGHWGIKRNLVRTGLWSDTPDGSISDATIEVTCSDTVREYGLNVVLVVVSNTSVRAPLNITDIELSGGYMTGFAVLSVDPMPERGSYFSTHDSPSFRYNVIIPPGGSRKFMFALKSCFSGHYSGWIDVFADDRFMRKAINTTIAERSGF